MILAVDIGNTNVNVALMGRGGKVIRRARFSSRGMALESFRKKLKYKGVEAIYIVSVVPEMTLSIKRALKNIFSQARIYIIGRDIKVPLRSLYNRKEIGQDRLITAFAAKTLYGKPVLVIDFGTAVTFDAVSADGKYLGGLILPGIKMSLESLYKGTAMLPKIHLKGVKKFIGKDTTSSIQAGMVFGYGAICESFINKFKKKFKNLKVIATGGDAGLIKKYAPHINLIDMDLSLKGLYLLALKKY